MLGLSVCRNPKLAAIFYRLQLIEAYGTGMPKIMKAYAGTGVEPKIEVTNNAFKITLPNRNAVKATDSVPNERKSNEEKIMDLIAQNGSTVGCQPNNGQPYSKTHGYRRLDLSGRKRQKNKIQKRLIVCNNWLKPRGQTPGKTHPKVCPLIEKVHLISERNRLS